MPRHVTTESFITEANIVHNNKYTYKNTVYVGSKQKVTITCATHGDFEQTPNNHTNKTRPRGCFECSKIRRSLLRRVANSIFIQRAQNVHGDKYSYKDTVYTVRRKKVTIICPKHDSFWQDPGHHVINKRGCPSCAKSGFDPDKPGILYYLKVTKPHCRIQYKIGITNRTVESRFSKTDLSYITTIWVKSFTSGKKCYREEQRILKEFKEYKYTGSSILESGNTELFNKDIFDG